MIAGVDHLVLLARDHTRTVQRIAALLGLAAAWRTESDGVATTLFTWRNASLEIMSPIDDGPIAARVQARIAADGEGLASLCFRVREIDTFAERLRRQGLAPEHVALSGSVNGIDGATLRWRRTRTDVAAACGLRLFFLELDGERPPSAASSDAPLLRLDYVTIAATQPQRTADLFGARLGLENLADPMAFRCGDLGLQLAPAESVRRENGDRLCGLTWRIADIEAARRRITEAGFGVTPIREDAHAGMRLFGVEDDALNFRAVVTSSTSGA